MNKITQLIVTVHLQSTEVVLKTLKSKNNKYLLV